MSTELLVLVAFVLIACAAVLTVVTRRRSAGAEKSTADDGTPPPDGEGPTDLMLQSPQDPEQRLRATVIRPSEALLVDQPVTTTPRAATPIAIDRMLQAVPTLAGALSKGEVVRIIGPQHLIDGIRGGLLQPTMTSTGPIGVVKGADGKFVGHLRFESGSQAKVPATIAGPLVLFQVASAVTMQYYLHQITSRLVELQRGVEQIKATLRAQTVGAVRGADGICRRLEGLVDDGIPFKERDQTALQAAETEARRAYETLRHELRGFAKAVDQSVDAEGRRRADVSIGSVKPLLKEGAGDGATRAVDFLDAMALRLRLVRLRALAEADAEPERVRSIRTSLEAELEDVRSDYRAIREPFDRLNFRKDEVDSTLSNAHDELRDYRAATKRLRAVVRVPERQALPAAPEPLPFLIEIRAGENGIESRYAMLEPSAS